MNRRFQILLVILLVVAGSGAIVALEYFSPLQTCSVENLAPKINFTIIESSQGYNDSKNHAAPFPVMAVHCGQAVTIHVQNVDTTEPHGFMINTYVVKEIVLGPGESYDVSFNATKLGTFKVQCTIPCIPHIYMLYGQLNVSA